MAGSTESCLRLLKLMPFSDLETNVDYLGNFVDEDALAARVDVPLAVATDTSVDRQFLTCDYNRDEDSYRSPFTNTYFPPMEDVDDPTLPSDVLRAQEELANEALGYYTRQYYGSSALHSAYYFDVDGTSFGSCWLIKKVVESDGELDGCVWDSKHIFQAQPSHDASDKWTYKLQTNIILTMTVKSLKSGGMRLAGHVQKTHTLTAPAKDDQDHIANMGKLLESSEQQARSEIDSLYVGKMHHITQSVRSIDGTADVKRGDALAKDLASFLKGNMGAVAADVHE